MTKLLLKILQKKHPDGNSGAYRAAVGSLSGTVGILCNTALFAVKLTVGILSGSVSIMADALNNLTDCASAIVTLLGFKLAEKPADSEHPYGHARYEYLTALAVAALILVIGFELAKSSVEKILNPTAVVMSLPMTLILVGAIGVKLWMFFFNRYLSKAIDSAALMATAADSRNDCIATFATLAAALLQAVFSWQLDGIMGLAVAVFILYSGISLARETISPLLGEAASPALRRVIRQELDAEPRVLGYHDLMVHDYGPGQRFGSLHVEMDSREDPMSCHELIDDLERLCLEKHNIHLVIHYDPVVTDDPELDAIKALVGQVLANMDERLSFHDLRMVKGVGHSNVIFDVSLPRDMVGKESAITQKVESALSESRQSTIHAVITFDPADFNEPS
nr:cation transporter [Oscillospiraceae bacterium]